MVARSKHNRYYQCQQCGYVHKEYCELTESGFIKMYCEKCREMVTQLEVGEEQEDVYIYYNVNIDKKYFDYTKQNG